MAPPPPREIRTPRKWIGWLFLAVVIVVLFSAIGSTRDPKHREIDPSDPLAADLASCDAAPQSLRCIEARQAQRRRAEFVKRLDEEGALPGR
jgi:hypothetical protein